MKKYFSAKMVAILLAVIMLVGILASCDKSDNPTLPQDDQVDDREEAPEENVKDEDFIEGVDFNVEKYKILEVENFTSEPYPTPYIETLLSLINFEKMLEKPTSTKVLMSDYDKIVNADISSYVDLIDGGEMNPFLCLALDDLSNPSKKRSNFAISCDSVDWTFRVVSTDYNFALIAIDSDGNVFLTGFVNGKFENDLGFIDQESVALIKKVAEKYSYNYIVNAVRREAMAEMYDRTMSDDASVVALQVEKFRDTDGNIMHYSQWTQSLDRIIFHHPATGSRLDGMVSYDVSEDYFDKLFEGGKVVNGTMMYNKAASCFYLPGQNHPYLDDLVDGDWNGDCLVDEYDKALWPENNGQLE